MLLQLSHDSISCPDATVSDFITVDKQWDIACLHQVLHDPIIINRILGVPLPSSDIPDALVWGCTSSGKFSLKSASWLAHDIHPSTARVWPYAWIWNLDTMPKILFFIWQLCHKALPVRLLLFSRGVDLDPLCPMCRQHNESIEHLFLSCASTLRLWSLAEDHYWIPRGFLSGTNNDLDTLLLTWQHQSSKLF